MKDRPKRLEFRIMIAVVLTIGGRAQGSQLNPGVVTGQRHIIFHVAEVGRNAKSGRDTRK